MPVDRRPARTARTGARSPARAAPPCRGLGRIHHREFAMGCGEMGEAEFTAFLQTIFDRLAVSPPCIHECDYRLDLGARCPERRQDVRCRLRREADQQAGKAKGPSRRTTR